MATRMFEDIQFPTSSLPFTSVALTLLLFYMASLAIYRLYFSPIAHIPGPTIAALTWGYEFYHDVIREGQYIWKIREMHERYGPVVRINPTEVHVSHPNFYPVLFSSQKKRYKTVHHNQLFGTPDGVLATMDHDLHRMRRAALSPFFSKASVRKLEPMIREKVNLMLDRLAEFQQSGKVVPLRSMYAALAHDIVSEYSFGKCDHRLEHNAFDPQFYNSLIGSTSRVHWVKYFSWFWKVSRAMPLWLAKYINKKAMVFVMIQMRMRQQIYDIQSGKDKSHQAASHRTIFHEVRGSDIPDSEKDPERLWQEGMVVVGAGTVTTAWTLSVATFHILSNQSIRDRLVEELQTVFPGNASTLSLSELERLPYLTACIQETLRVSDAVTGRMPRTALESLEVDGTVIPPGVEISMNNVFVHHDPDIFSEPYEFRPDRWLENPRLDHYMVAFAKGARACLGINLAYAELYMALGGIFRRFGVPDHGVQLVLYQTSKEDVETAADMILPRARKGSQGVRAVFRMAAV